MALIRVRSQVLTDGRPQRQLPHIWSVPHLLLPDVLLTQLPCLPSGSALADFHFPGFSPFSVCGVSVGIDLCRAGSPWKPETLSSLGWGSDPFIPPNNTKNHKYHWLLASASTAVNFSSPAVAWVEGGPEDAAQSPSLMEPNRPVTNFPADH